MNFFRRISPITSLVLILVVLLFLALMAPQLWSQPSSNSSKVDNSPLVSEIIKIVDSVSSIPPPTVERFTESPPPGEATQPDAADQRLPSPELAQILQKLEEIARQNQQLQREIRQQIVLNVINFVFILFLIIPIVFSSDSTRRERPQLTQDSQSSQSIYGSPSTPPASRRGLWNPGRTSTPQVQTPLSSRSRYNPTSRPTARTPQPSPKNIQPSASPSIPTPSPSPSTYSNEAQNIAAVYNKNPRQLKQNSTPVSIPKETMNQIRSGKSVPMSFTPDNNGNYWLVPSSTNYLNYLVPKEKLSVNENTFESLCQIFKSQNYSPAYAKAYCLIEPAQVKQSSPNQWELVTPGQIVFG